MGNAHLARSSPVEINTQQSGGYIRTSVELAIFHHVHQTGNAPAHFAIYGGLATVLGRENQPMATAVKQII